MAESSGAAVEQAGFALPEDLMLEIIERLPTLSILRFRATSKFWHRRASDPAVLLAHHLRQPAQPLLCSQLSVEDEGEDAFLMAFYYYCLEAVDLRSPLQRRLVVRFKGTGTLQFEPLEVHGSCDGLLLLGNLDAHFVCNPATRQWARLPPLPAREYRIAGFYAHPSSGTYRVLYLRKDDEIDWEYYVLTVGSREHARRIERRASSDSLADALATFGLARSEAVPAVLLHGSLHWPLPYFHTFMPVFDTADESFRSMSPPAVTNMYSKRFLFGTKEGKLAMSIWEDGWMAELWIMQDYQNQVWTFTYKIQVPLENRGGKGMPLNVTIVSQDGDMLVEFLTMLLHYDKNGSLLQTLNCNGSVIPFTRHFLKESLVQHPFLHKQQDDPVGPPFFESL